MASLLLVGIVLAMLSGIMYYLSTKKQEQPKRPVPKPVPKKKRKPKVDITAKYRNKARKSKKQEKRETLNHPLMKSVFRGHKASIMGVDIRQDNKLMATVSDDRTMRVWTLEEGVKQHRYKLIDLLAMGSAVRFSSSGQVLCVALGSDRKRKLQFWGVKLKKDKKTKKEHVVMSDKPIHEFVTTHTCDITSIEWGPSDAFVMTCAKGLDTHINFYTPKGRCLVELNSNQLKNNMAALSPDGKFVSVATRLPDVKVWELIYSDNDVTKAAHAMSLRGHTKQVAYLSLVNNRIATLSVDGTCRVFDTNVRYHLDEDPKLLMEYRCEEKEASMLQISPDGLLLAIAAGSHLVFVNTKSKKVAARIETSRKGQISSLRFSHDGEVLAIGGGSKEAKIFKVPYPEGHTPYQAPVSRRRALPKNDKAQKKGKKRSNKKSAKGKKKQRSKKSDGKKARKKRSNK